MADWSFLTLHARVLLQVAERPDARLRDLADELGVTERRVFAIVADLTEAGYVVKQRAGRRNHYHVQEHLPVPLGYASCRERTMGELLGLLMTTKPPVSTKPAVSKKPVTSKKSVVSKKRAVSKKSAVSKKPAVSKKSAGRG